MIQRTVNFVEELCVCVAAFTVPHQTLNKRANSCFTLWLGKTGYVALFLIPPMLEDNLLLKCFVDLNLRIFLRFHCKFLVIFFKSSIEYTSKKPWLHNPHTRQRIPHNFSLVRLIPLTEWTFLPEFVYSSACDVPFSLLSRSSARWKPGWRAVVRAQRLLTIKCLLLSVYESILGTDIIIFSHLPHWFWRLLNIWLHLENILTFFAEWHHREAKYPYYCFIKEPLN